LPAPDGPRRFTGSRAGLTGKNFDFYASAATESAA
jgi:hypothetical protein